MARNQTDAMDRKLIVKITNGHAVGRETICRGWGNETETASMVEWLRANGISCEAISFNDLRAME